MKMKTLFVMMFCTFTAGTAMAQSLKKWNWGTYKMAFQAPSDFSVDKNNAQIFDAGNGKLHLTIYPEKGEKFTQASMKGLLKEWAQSNKLKWGGKVSTMEDLNGYWGVYVDGTSPEGLPTSVLMLVDPDFPEISFYVWLQYQDGELDTAVEILKSFIPS